MHPTPAMCQILLLLLGRDLRKLYSDGGRGKGGQIKVNYLSWLLVSMKGEKKENVECHFV